MNRLIASILILGLLVYSSPIHSRGQSQMIEVYQIEEEKVIKKIPSTTAIQAEAEKYLSNIEGIYKKINPIPKKGAIIRIPLRPSLEVQNQWIHTLADELNIIFPDGQDPYIMIYDDENNFYFFTIDRNQLDLSKMAKYVEISQ